MDPKHLLWIPLLLAASSAAQDARIRVPLDPRISPDANLVVFSWQGDVWSAAVDGTAPARRLTLHPASDRSPIVSPDGSTVLFTSDRAGGRQVFVMPIDGGVPRQVTFDSESKAPLQFTSDGAAFIAVRGSDRAPFSTESRRLVEIPLERNRPERLLFDVGTSGGAVSPDGQQVLFVRGRIEPTRKGYRGSAAMQIWHADLGTEGGPAIRRLGADRPDFQNVSERDPLWLPDGSGYCYVSDPDGTFEVFRRDLDGELAVQVTHLGDDGSDDGVLSPSLSADGKTLLFRRRFDLHVLDLESGAVRTLELRASGDTVASPIQRRRLSGASAVAFTHDGKQIAFVAGHDVYVMDRILREPVAITSTPSVESDLVFTEDGARLFFVSDADGEVDVWEATIDGRDDGHWWRADTFSLRKVTDDRAVEADLTLSPTGKHIAYIKDADLFVMDADGTDHRRLVESWNAPRYDWSPDGKWVCYSVQDDEFNNDVFVLPLDGTRPPFNLSRHPDADSSPVWSPDGVRIAWTGRRDGEESDVYYVTLTREIEEETDRDRKLKKAIEAMAEKGARGSKRSESGKPGADQPDDAKAGAKADDEAKAPEDPEAKTDEKDDDDDPDVRIDFEGIHDRLSRIRITDSRERGLIWSPDGKKLAFSASVDGKSGFFAVTFPDELRPKRIGSSGLSSARWLKEGNQIVGLSSGGGGGVSFRGMMRGGGGGGRTPAKLDPKGGKVETFSFTVLEERDWRDVRRLAFDQGWRAMRDSFYDAGLNGRDWDAVRAKYRPVAAELLGRQEFSALMNMMLGELNASHMGHSGGSDPLPSFRPEDTWTPRTRHLGLRFDLSAGPGLLVESVIPGSPCALERSLVRAGERVLEVDGEAVGPDTDLYALMTTSQTRDMVLKVRGAEAAEREVTVRPVTSVSRLLYDEWIEATRRRVEELSDGRLGYLHIRGMNDSSFRQLEEDFFHAGAGKDGLIIDVRFNGGGSTADHVLTALTQPRHAMTVPRGGGVGYPQDRKIYATWSKPIVLMCNEMSFSNAEILAHAVKTLGRGQVVGMRTAGGVISTGGRGLVDGSMVRMPFRGWYVSADGQDMELNGCIPDYALWNDPAGGDAQLDKAVEVLRAEVAAAPEDPEPVPASARR